MNPQPPNQQTSALSTDGLYFMSDLTEFPEPHPVLICVFFFAGGVGAGHFWFWWVLLKRQSQSLDLPRVVPLF